MKRLDLSTRIGVGLYVVRSWHIRLQSSIHSLCSWIWVLLSYRETRYQILMAQQCFRHHSSDDMIALQFRETCSRHQEIFHSLRDSFMTEWIEYVNGVFQKLHFNYLLCRHEQYFLAWNRNRTWSCGRIWITDLLVICSLSRRTVNDAGAVGQKPNHLGWTGFCQALAKIRHAELPGLFL